MCRHTHHKHHECKSHDNRCSEDCLHGDACHYDPNNKGDSGYGKDW